ncbi:SDR family NAD(P)-dependent oxidoreductase [Conexibacter sp. SYSU D00693]|uniref:SDR family NAD(P)-dependent oxidoreductase n=1 Tax=Conexibacter sp. SYSU D00693 TaxID=2812560 RepID=UPI00196B8706|nr:SDR family NAD(P)-dependent oxidoreductase [Conexibacter sp. SYSU D00693]
MLQQAGGAQPGSRGVAITGGARGIGLATAKALSAQGDRVVLGDLDGELAALEASRIPGAAGFALDVTDEASFAGFLDEARAHLGRLDVLVNNAGIMPTGPFLEQSPELAARMLEVNVLGVARGVRLALPEMLERRHGQVVNVASVAGRSVAAGMATYCATKHAVVGLTRALRREHHASGVRFTLVMPSFTNTRLVDGADAGLVPVAEPGEVAAAIAQAIAQPRDELVVPRAAAVLTHAIERLLPRAAADALARRLGADRMFLTADGRDRGAGPTQREAVLLGDRP